MTVKDLIELLQKENQDADVVFNDGEGQIYIAGVFGGPHLVELNEGGN